VLDALHGSNKKFKSWLAELAARERRELMGAANVDNQAVLKRARRELADAEPLKVQTIWKAACDDRVRSGWVLLLYPAFLSFWTCIAKQEDLALALLPVSLSIPNFAAMAPYELKWGILSTGRIAVAFAKDLLVNPRTRGVTDVKHKIAAVASRDAQKARSFIKENLDDDSSIKAYGSYQELYDDQVRV
jgi:hypothetical protein